MPVQLVTIKVIAERTGFAVSSIYRMAREGRIPATLIGRSIRFDSEAIDRWLARQPKASS